MFAAPNQYLVTLVCFSLRGRQLGATASCPKQWCARDIVAYWQQKIWESTKQNWALSLQADLWEHGFVRAEFDLCAYTWLHKPTSFSPADRTGNPGNVKRRTLRCQREINNILITEPFPTLRSYHLNIMQESHGHNHAVLLWSVSTMFYKSAIIHLQQFVCSAVLHQTSCSDSSQFSPTSLILLICQFSLWAPEQTAESQAPPLLVWVMLLPNDGNHRECQRKWQQSASVSTG